MDLIDSFRIPLWREGLFPLERAALARDPVFRGEGVPAGAGEPVMLIPGFLAGDLSLGLMARWLRSLGYCTSRAGIRANVDCTERTLGRLTARIEQTAERHGQRVRIVGHSRGGTMARILAVRRPDLIEQIVCLGSPLTDQLAIHPVVEAQVRTTALLGSIGMPGFFSYGCHDGCCATAEAERIGPFPKEVGFTSIYSRSDGVVAWRCCLDPAADPVQVSSSHCGMAVNPQVYRAVGDALAPRMIGATGSPPIAAAA